MANAKTGFDYFASDTDKYSDIRIKRLKHTFSTAGVAVYDYILCEIYRDKGCFLEWGESTAFEVADYFRLKESTVGEIVNYCVAVGLFDKKMYETTLPSGGRIITSTAIQRRYVDMCKRAKRTSEIPKNILILPNNDDIPPKNDNIPPKNKPIKEKYIERNYNPTSSVIIEKESKPTEESAKEKRIFGFDLSFIGDDFKDCFIKWLTYKKDRKESYKTQQSVELAYKRLLKYSDCNPDVAVEVVEQSMANNWAGLFELKDNGKSKTNKGNGGGCGLTSQDFSNIVSAGSRLNI